MSPLLWNIVLLSAILISTVGSVKVVMNTWSGRRSRAGSCSHGSEKSLAVWVAAIHYFSSIGQGRAGLRKLIILACMCSLALYRFSPGTFSRCIYNRHLELLLIKQCRRGLSDYLLAATSLVHYISFIQIEMNCRITTVNSDMLNSLRVAFGNSPIVISKFDLSQK